MKKYLYTVNMQSDDAPAKVLRSVGRGKRVLEIGCASGVQTQVMTEQLGCIVTGIEIDHAAAEEARKYANKVVVGDLEVLDLSAELSASKFDVITIADVLEHLKNPLATLKGLSQFLDKDGYVIASIPNIAHAGLVLELAKGRFDYRTFGLLDDTHLKFFTLKTVCKLFEDAGLDITHLDRVERDPTDTEFINHPTSPAEQSILSFIQAHNPEWRTYQFIVTARASHRDVRLPDHKQLTQTEAMADLKLSNQALQFRLQRIERSIANAEVSGTTSLLNRLLRCFRREPNGQPSH